MTVDYGTNEGITVTLVGPKPEEAVTSTVFYDKETKKVKVISIEKVTEVKEQKENYYGQVTPISYPVTTIPSIAIETVMSTDNVFSEVVNVVQHSEHIWSGVVPTTTEVEPISNDIVKYTVTMEKETTKKQVVVVYNTKTSTSEIVTSDVFKPQGKPFYVTEVVTEGVKIIESNSVEEISNTHPEVTKVLEYSNQWLHISPDWVSVSNVQVVPSTAEGGNTVYTVDSQTETQVQTIQISYNTVT